MSFSGSTHDLPRLNNYAKAEKFFKETRKPPRSKNWDEHQRPLKDVRSYHYRIERGINGSHYDLVLHSTVMARFHAPDAQGHERRQYIAHGSQTSRGFMWHVLGVSGFTQVATPQGEKRTMIISTMNMNGGNSQFSVDAYFDENNKLVLERSTHTNMMRRVSDTRDKAARARFRERATPLLTLMAMRMDEFVANVTFDYHLAGAFKGANVSFDEQRTLRRLCDALRDGGAPSQEQVEALATLGQKVFDKIASDRADEEGLLAWNLEAPDYAALEKPVDHRAFITSLQRKLESYARTQNKSGHVLYPQFPPPDVLVWSNCYPTSKTE